MTNFLNHIFHQDFAHLERILEFHLTPLTVDFIEVETDEVGVELLHLIKINLTQFVFESL